jgi:cell division protein FtsI (penicillin-binding protein 3)
MTKPGSKKVTAIKWIRFRIVVVGTFLALCFGVIIGRSVQLQVLSGPELCERAEGQYKRAFHRMARRGTIYDRNLKELAVSIDASSICAYPRLVYSPQETALALSQTLNLDRGLIFQRLSSGKRFVWIKRHVSPKEEDAVRNMALDGIDFRTESRRVYPQKDLAAQVIGFCGIDGKGLEGLEYYYDDFLRGRETSWTTINDALGHWFTAGPGPIENRDGCNLILTIDKDVQYIAEQALSKSVKEFSARSGMAIVMVPGTGAILAVAHVPQFNPNTFGLHEPWHWRNRAITDFFEPGSTFKIFLAAAALESGLCTPDAEFYCENGAYRVGNNVIHDLHSYGTLSLRDILKYSSNIGAAKIGERIGPKKLHARLQAFGFGDKTSVDWPYERSGILKPVGSSSAMDALAICFGQGVSVSALQLTTAVAAIANSGLLMKPYFIQELTDRRGRLIRRVEPTIIRRVVSSGTARTLTHMLERVIAKGGTGVQAALKGYRVAGKTGTAQKTDPDGQGYARDKHISAFVGFAPSQDPKVVVLVVVDEPKGHYYGGVVAAPVFREIARETLQYLRIPPELVTPEEKGSFTASREEVPVG